MREQKWYSKRSRLIFRLNKHVRFFISLYLFVPRSLRWSINFCDISDIDETTNGFDRFSSSRVRHNEAPFLSLSFEISTDCDTMSTYLRAQRMIEDCFFLSCFLLARVEAFSSAGRAMKITLRKGLFLATLDATESVPSRASFDATCSLNGI